MADEFELGRRLALGSGPMKDLAVFFKVVDDAKLRDPGPQLQKVLAFRQRRGKELLFSTSNTTGGFATMVRRLSLSWLAVMKHERRTPREPTEGRKGWLDLLMEHLAPPSDIVTVWSDKSIEMGHDWHTAVQGVRGRRRWPCFS
jgi:hypothetical protein